MGFAVLLCLPPFARLVAVSSLGVVAIYPLMKRVISLPQLVLGLAFSWGALMGWAAAFGTLSLAPVALYIAAIAWTIGYDTIYAHQDKEDDALIGVRSTARLFGDSTAQWLVGLYGLTVALIALAFWLAGVGLVAWLGLAAAALMLGWQIRTLDIDDPVQCLALFKFNHIVGFAIFLALAVAIPFA